MDYKYFTFGAYKTRERAEVRRDLILHEVDQLEGDVKVFYDANCEMFVVETNSRWPEYHLSNILEYLAVDFKTSEKKTCYHLLHGSSAYHVADEQGALSVIRATPAYRMQSDQTINIKEVKGFRIYLIKGADEPFFLALGEDKEVSSLLYYFSELKNVHIQAKALESILDNVCFENADLSSIVERLQNSCHYVFTSYGEYYGTR